MFKNILIWRRFNARACPWWSSMATSIGSEEVRKGVREGGRKGGRKLKPKAEDMG